MDLFSGASDIFLFSSAAENELCDEKKGSEPVLPFHTMGVSKNREFLPIRFRECGNREFYRERHYCGKKGKDGG